MKLASLLSLVALSIVTGCAAQTSEDGSDQDQDTSEDAIKAASVTPGSFRLYGDPGHKPSGCDVYTKLDLANAGGAKATLSERVGGMCMLALPPNVRSYKLHQTGTSCGSKIYEGTFSAKDGAHAIKITDNRSRMCLDLLLAEVVVEETVPGFPGAITQKLYSMWPQPAPETTTTVEGSLFHSVGIGGENTGRSIKTGTEVFELVLDAGEEKLFTEGRVARVKGTKTLLSGIETHDRPAINVTDLLVCPAPGWVNCMPARESRGPLCEAENRSWIGSHCAGVMFAD